MSPLPGTAPEQIVDKNGKITTVHKKQEASTTDSRLSRIPVINSTVITDENDLDGEERAYLPTREYVITTVKIPKFNAVLAKANARLERAGVEDRFKVVYETEVKENGEGGFTEYVIATINKPVISHNGWHFSAAHDFTPAGDVVSHWVTEEGEHVKPTDAHCDQCGTNRRRERVYTVTHDSGDTKQVGSTCIDTFLGVKPEGLWSITDTKIDDDLSDIEEMTYEGGGTGGPILYKLRDVIATSLAITGNGSEYVSQAKSDFNNPSTASQVREFLSGGALKEPVDVKTDSPDVEAVINFVRESTDDNSEYFDNLKTIIGKADIDETYVNSRHTGIAASAVSAWYRSMNPYEKAEKETYKQEYIAPPGTKITEDMDLTVTFRDEFETQWGTTTLIIMKDSENRLIKWGASNPPDVWEGGKLQIGRMTVKDNEEYKGNKQTSIIRPKVNSVQSVGKAPGWYRDSLMGEYVRSLPDSEKEAKYEAYEAAGSEEKSKLLAEWLNDETLAHQ